jgi:hypothetical protein
LLRIHPHAACVCITTSNGDDHDDHDSTTSQRSSPFAASCQDSKIVRQQPWHSISLPQGFWQFSIAWTAVNGALSVICATDALASCSGEVAEWVSLRLTDSKARQWHLSSHKPGESAAENNQHRLLPSAAEWCTDAEDEQPEFESSVCHRVAD